MDNNDITQISFFVRNSQRDKVLKKLETLGITTDGNVTIKNFPSSHTFAAYVANVNNIESDRCINCQHDEYSHEKSTKTCYGLYENHECKCRKFIPIK